MAATVCSKIATIVLRVVTFVLLFISLLVLATTSKTWAKGTEDETKFGFKDVKAYRYMISTIIIGAALNLLQIAFTLYNIVTKGDRTLLFDFCSDKFLSYLLLSGAAAGLGAGVDLKANFNSKILRSFFGDFFNSFFDKANAAAALLFLAFLCSAIVSVLSSIALIKKP